MNQLLQNKLDNLPEQPGVYLMKDGDGSIIYIGKAKVLKNRVRQYFQSPSGHAIKVRKMVERIRDIDYYVTDSEVEALMLECNLIKQHRPYYNILMKDDKSYPYLMLTTSENYPRLILTRKRKLDGNKYFGPYVNAYAARQTLEAINQTYRLKRCNKQISYGTPSGRVCLQYHMDNCQGVCRGDVREEDYRNAIDEVEQILTNRPELLIHRLRQEMQEESEQLHFEAAAAIRDRIEAVQALHTEQKISNPSFDERDILALAAEDSEACIQLFQIRNGKITRTETKELRIDGEERSEILSSFLEQYYTSGAYIPHEILVPFLPEETELIENMLAKLAGHRTQMKVPQRGSKKRLLNLAAQNAAMHLEVKRSRKERREKAKTNALGELQEILHTETLPFRIEAYDISNISGTDNVGVMVAFENAQKLSSALRKFKIKSVEGQNDIGSMTEVLQRRLAHAQEEIENETQSPKFLPLPEVIFVDGGLTHVRNMTQAIASFGYPIAVAGLVKDRHHKLRGLVLEDGTEIAESDLDASRRLVNDISEEVHRAAVGYHQQTRSKTMLRTELESVEGIGKARAAALLKHFGSLKKIKEATPDQLCEAKGMTRSAAQKIYEHFHSANEQRDSAK